MVLAAAFLLVVLVILVVRGERKSNFRHSRPMNGRDCLLSYGRILAMICRSIDGPGRPKEFPEGLRVPRSVHPSSQVVPREIWVSPQISARCTNLASRLRVYPGSPMRHVVSQIV